MSETITVKHLVELLNMSILVPELAQTKIIEGAETTGTLRLTVPTSTRDIHVKITVELKEHAPLETLLTGHMQIGLLKVTKPPAIIVPPSASPTPPPPPPPPASV